MHKRSRPRDYFLKDTARERVSSNGLYILGLVVVLIVPVVLLKPALPSWLPVGIVRLAVMLEHLRR